MLLTTHYMFEADALCDRIAVIAKGRIVGEGTPRGAEGRCRRRARHRDRRVRRRRRNRRTAARDRRASQPSPSRSASRRSCSSSSRRRPRVDRAAPRGARRLRGRARLRRASRHSKTRTSRSSRPNEVTQGRRERVPDEPEDARDVELLPADLDRPAGHLRDRRLLHVPRGRAGAGRFSTRRSVPG